MWEKITGWGMVATLALAFLGATVADLMLSDFLYSVGGLGIIVFGPMSAYHLLKK